MRSRFVAKFIHAVSRSCKSLLAWPIFQPARFLKLNIKRINSYCRSHFLHLLINIEALTLIIKFLLNCLISSFHCTVVPAEISYTCSICSLEFRWLKRCEAQLRLSVENFFQSLFLYFQRLYYPIYKHMVWKRFTDNWSGINYLPFHYSHDFSRTCWFL